MRGGGKVENAEGRKPVVTGIDFCFEIKKSLKNEMDGYLVTITSINSDTLKGFLNSIIIMYILEL